MLAQLFLLFCIAIGFYCLGDVKRMIEEEENA